MRVDFYQLSQDPAAAATALLARKVREAGHNLLVVAGETEQLEATSRAIWESAPEAFLANGIAGTEHDARQPILLSTAMEPANSARFVLIADGHWREPGEGFERVFYLFDDATIAEARETWRMLAGREGAERHFWKQQDGRWVEGP